MFVGIIEHSARWLKDCKSLPAKNKVVHKVYTTDELNIKFVYAFSVIDFVSTFYV